MSLPSRAVLARVFPFLAWWPRVNRASLRVDLIAGLIGAAVVLPQGVAFATLAGMPPEYGLYCAMVPTIVAALWGSSWHAVSGPTNAVSLVVFATVSTLAEPGSAHYVHLVLTLSLMSGLIMLTLGILRLGTLVNFISHTVVVGFTAGAGVLIFGAQLRNFFGVDIERSVSFLRTLEAFALQITNVNPYVLLVAMVTLATGILARRYVKQVPYMIAAMLAGSVVAFALNQALGEQLTGIRTLGALPGALPPLSRPDFELNNLRKLLSIAVAVTVLGLTEAVSIGRAIALKTGQRIDGNQEFIGQGLSNIVASFFSGYPATASFNRSGLNYEAGAHTPLAAVFSSLFLIMILVFVAPLMAYLPLASMAAILFLVAWGLIDFASIRTILRASRPETAVLALTFSATLLMELEFAILVGVMLSLLVYLNRTSRPSMRSLVPDPRHETRKMTVLGEGLVECPQLKMLRIEGSIYFGAVNHVDSHFDTLREVSPGQKHLLLMAKSINFVDVAGAELLAHEAGRRRKMGGQLYMYSLRQPVRDMLERGGYVDQIGRANIFGGKSEAIGGVFARLERSICARCNARIFNECAALPPAEK
ncbi:MAG: SulP family inorganic anion transporter [Betaproteobacteria bacterium]|nr:MAG: SulP family inorganic anion transporter [Betaproteobacteria bacterium]